MQYKAQTPAEYLNQLEDDWRKPKLLAIRNIILSYVPNIQEGIEYKMLSYGNGKSTVFHLNAQKNYVSLYVGNISKVENGKELLKGIDLGKGCIRIKKSTQIYETGLEEFIHKAINLYQQGVDMEC
jgi:uncharacterized protein YdhG (YjbR/CyaY superfamily)